MNEEKLSRLRELVKLFDSNIETYKGKNYDESNTRTDFIDKFFELLDWDMANTQGFAEQYRDVVREDKVVIEGKPKAPDYSFRIGGTRKFFVEAKRPSVNIKDDYAPAFQVRRYGYTAKLPLSILTDFEEFAVYDTRIKPSKTDNPGVARVFYGNFKDYEKNWDFIYNTFSKNAILKGSFDKYVQQNKNKKGSSEIDKEFLKLIEGWRNELAKNIAIRNKDLTIHELNHAVQTIIDRIIFLRIAEDRNMETYETLSKIADKENIYKSLEKIFVNADKKYNSGLFEIKKYISDLSLDDKVLKPILKGLYYPDCPYEFSVLGVEILGQIYEQFLGKTIRLTAGHQAKIEEKPEVRKAGGVYYTPQYIVEYIVKNTIGEKVKSQNPEKVSELKICDPACGSGSFLLGAYEFLLDWHLAYYTDEKNRKKTLKESKIYQTSNTDFHLSIEEKQKILINNIFGVDIDAQAVEVTKLSLLLKLMEGENEESCGQLFKFSDLKILPDLSRNIKCGNSLIGSDFYSDTARGQDPLFQMDEEQMRRVNVFDWEEQFPRIFENGGFDCVIGNPPYVLFQSLNQPQVFEYVTNKYQSAKYKIDAYQIFIEKSICLLNKKGLISFITPNTFLRNKHSKDLRQFILENSSIERIHIYYYPVFADASVDTLVFIFSKEKNLDRKIKIYQSQNLEEIIESEIIQSDWKNHEFCEFSILLDKETKEILKKFQQISIPLGEFATAYFGIQTFDRKKYVSEIKHNQNFMPVIDGGAIHEYYCYESTEFVDFQPSSIKSGGDPKVYKQERICLRQIGKFPTGTLIPAETYTLNTIYNVFFTKETEFSLKFILGIINSSAIKWYWHKNFFDYKKTFPKIKKAPILSIPIPKITLEQQKPITDLVDQMLETQKKLHSAKLDSDRKMYEQKAKILDKKIDDLVFDLYGLGEEERRIVSES